MRRILFAALVAIAAIAHAHAQGGPAAPGAAATVPVELLNRVYVFLQNGGTYAEAQGLREALVNNAQAPQREAEIQRRIDTAIAEAAKKAAAPAPKQD